MISVESRANFVIFSPFSFCGDPSLASVGDGSKKEKVGRRKLRGMKYISPFCHPKINNNKCEGFKKLKDFESELANMKNWMVI